MERDPIIFIIEKSGLMSKFKLISDFTPMGDQPVGFIFCFSLPGNLRFPRSFKSKIKPLMDY